MNESFDILTIIFLGLAVFFFLRLRSVLGTRNGHEQQQRERHLPQDNVKSSDDNNVVSLPGVDLNNEKAEQDTKEARKKMVEEFAPEGSKLADDLIKVLDASPGFDISAFLEGARRAYEMIVDAFANGDKKLLKPLLDREVFAGFTSSIDERNDRGEVVETSLVGIKAADIIEAALEDKNLNITVKFLSSLITATKNSDGEVIEGDPKKIRDITDIWTFSRNITSRNPNWKLVSTAAVN
jgi:predicted lipid-binding transport protein (Tim44 family)